jgi:hypothetical protein
MFGYIVQYHFIIENREISEVLFFSVEDFISPECKKSADGLGIFMLREAVKVLWKRHAKSEC